MKRKVSTVFTLFILLFLLMAAIFSSTLAANAAGKQQEKSPSDTLKLAILAPLTGPIPDLGKSARDGALLAIEEQNASGGVLGMTVEQVVEDTSCNASKAVDAANKVISQDGVHYIIGDVCSSSTIPVTEVTDAAGVILMTPSATNPQVTVRPEGQVKEYVFRACFTDPYQGTVAAMFARDSLSAQTAFVMINADNSYPQGLASAFEREFSKSGTIVGKESYSEGDTDFSAILNKVAAAQPDVVYLPDFPNIVNQVTDQAKKKGITTPFLGGDGWDSPNLDITAASGGFFINHMSYEDPRPEVAAFDQAFNNKYGYAPDTIAALAYDAARLVLQGIVQAGNADPVVVKTILASISFQGVTGSLYYDPSHNPIKSAAVMSVDKTAGVHLYILLNQDKPGPNLSINYRNGSPDSYFTLTGSYFPPSSQATVSINSFSVDGPIVVNSTGGFVFRLDTTAADEGRYFVTAAVNPSATTSFELGEGAPLRSLEGDGSVITVPAGIAYTQFIQLPIVRR
jgi:branched-chain amino acid transport system substrate-binding protein